LIRGGDNSVQITVSPQQAICPRFKNEYLIVLNQASLDRHLAELTYGKTVVLDSDLSVTNSLIQTNKLTVVSLPIKKLLTDQSASDLLTNTLFLGAIAAILRADITILQQLIRTEFVDKNEELVQANLSAVQSGFDYISSHYSSAISGQLIKTETTTQILFNGNEAAALGAIAGGLQFASIYPMSPISNILHILAKQQKAFNFIYKQPEDEIAAINLALGASFAGARAITATSGGGFCLMTEGYSLAGMTETPLVIIYGMRGGPATGLPTWSSQADLQFVLNAGHGEFPRIVLAPCDSQETFYFTQKAFNLAAVYQTPVIVLLDKNICEHEQNFPQLNLKKLAIENGKTVLNFDNDYQRYQLTDNGISPRSFPGTSNFFSCNSYEHNEQGLTSENSETINQQYQKRLQKTVTILKNEDLAPKLFGPVEADLTILSWGSNYGSILTALSDLPKVNYLHFPWLAPFPTDQTIEKLKPAKQILAIEANSSGQLAELVSQKTGIQIPNRLLKSNGRPFFAEEIVKKVNNLLK
jgi:2-oxoglutarate ferredoxin oxidoreductase subunit alpha